MKTLIIAEKPSVARDIASALGGIKKKDDWLEGEDYVISSAVGHLVELFMPEDIDKKLKFWRLEPLPIIPQKFELKPIEKTKKQFNLLKKLIKRKDVDTIINGCDAGREGELIFTYIYEAAKSKKPVKRLWMQSMTKGAIKTAFENLREGEELAPLRDAARSRSEADWLIGINGTRAITKRMFGSARGNVATVGRVQTPTLALVMDRERTILGFEPKAFWRIKAEFGVTNGNYEGTYQKNNWKKGDNEDDRQDRLWTEEEANKLYAELEAIDEANVVDKKKRSRQAPQRLYDLTTLQREANRRYGMPATITLKIAQSLYEKHKVLTYPRTDSRCLPEDYLPTCKSVMGILDGNIEKFAKKALAKDYVKFSKRIFDNKKISDHFAIIPTEVPAGSKKLNDDEKKIYDMVARRFISIFYPSAEYDVTTRISSLAEHEFKTEGKVLAIPGWQEVYEKMDTEETLPALSEEDGDPAKAEKLSIEFLAEATKPPARYSEASLLSAMESAGKFVDDDELAEAMKEKGLGTPATRAQIIEHLIRERYIDRENRELIPTTKAEGLIDFLKAVKIKGLVNAGLTGEWEHKLVLVEQGKLSREEFMKGISEHATRIVDKTKNFEEKDEDAEITNIISPSDNKPMLATLRTFKSQDEAYVIYKTVGNRKMKEEEIVALLKDRKIGPIDGFRSKMGKPYSAMLELNEENKVRFVFDNGMGGDGTTSEETKIDLSTLRVAGKSPVDDTEVYETPTAYASKSWFDGDKSKGLRLSRTILNKTIPFEEAEKLFSEGKTGLLEGFKSKRTGRLFSAHLLLKKNGSIGFEFPPRAAKKATKKTAKKASKKTATKKTAKKATKKTAKKAVKE